ncbi:MAG: hypothetical protein WC796_01975 [Candidatus Pacearchaeota archaeon]|jgi:hypothetical protein
MLSDDPNKRETAAFLEFCGLPGMITGRFLNLKRVESPLVGITGWSGDEYQRGEQPRSTWIHGEIISPVFIDNGGCACRSHIEGIATDTGKLHLVEQVYDFLAWQGDCYEYLLATEDPSKYPFKFEGSVIARNHFNGRKPLKVGEVAIELNPFWQTRDGSGTSISCSVRYNGRQLIQGVYIPEFWKEFLGQIEDMGYKHPYQSVRGKTKKTKKR